MHPIFVDAFVANFTRSKYMRQIKQRKVNWIEGNHFLHSEYFKFDGLWHSLTNYYFRCIVFVHSHFYYVICLDTLHLEISMIDDIVKRISRLY